MKPWHDDWNEVSKGNPRLVSPRSHGAGCVCGASRDGPSDPLRSSLRDNEGVRGKVTGYLKVFLMGYFLVLLVSSNTYQIAHQHYLGATLVGGLISLTWWFNARNAGRSELLGAGFVYAFGAAMGTLTGLLIMTSIWGKG